MSFFLPFRDESASLAKTVAEITEAAGVSLSEFEIILVDDGSTDASPRIARELSDGERIRVITLNGHEGFGKAFLSGLRAARFPYAMYLGADGDVYCEELKEILLTWKGDCPLVQYPTNDRERPLFRFALSRLHTLLVRSLTGMKLPYFNGFNILPAQAARDSDLRDFGFCTQAHVLIQLLPKSRPAQVIGTLGRFHDSTSKSLSRRNFTQAARFFRCLAADSLRFRGDAFGK